MPGFNGTGPQGMGPGTGGGRGFCTPGTGNNYNTGTSRGIGRRETPWGGGRGHTRGGGQTRGMYRPVGNYAYTAPPYGAYNPDPAQNIQQEIKFLIHLFKKHNGKMIPDESVIETLALTGFAGSLIFKIDKHKER